MASSSNIQKTETTSSVTMEQLKHFSHKHILHLVQLQPHYNNENFDKEDEDEDEDEVEDKDDFVAEDPYVGKCKMCEEEIYSFHLCYYTCKDCDYSLHKFCAQLPSIQQNHPLHPGHTLTLSQGFQLHDPDFSLIYTADSEWVCAICKVPRKMYNYHCSICKVDIDIVCATMSEQKMEHPSHPHQLQRNICWMISFCHACGNKHGGTFYSCTTCSWFKIHLDCALLPAKLHIQRSTDGDFSHSHLLTLAYSFPYNERRAKFFPPCRVCNKGFQFREWHYRCNKCQYYVHAVCATSGIEAFMSSILMPAGLGKTYKNFKDDDHQNLIHCPFPDESVNLLMHHFINKGESVNKRKIDGAMFCHPHPLILFDNLLNGSVSLHDPMKKVELLCDGCVRPIISVPFYKCSQHCDFFLHEWCTRLPSEIKDHHNHPEHTLVFMPKIPKWLGVFWCKICVLPCNGFAYGCMQCNYYVDINCGFIPDVITHEAHPNHLLLRFKSSSVKKYCKACRKWMSSMGFHCPTCDFYLHIKCALLLPGTIRHRYDQHPLSLRYYPAENHSNEYFCDICEDEFDPTRWFYHCSTCASSMHTACAPLKLQCEQSTFSKYKNYVFVHFNIKFGRRYMHRDHPHHVTFVQGIKVDGQCTQCGKHLQYYMIFKCFRCKFALHYWCGSSRIKEIPYTSI